MPTYVSHHSGRLRMIELGVALKFDMQYFYHADAKDSPAVRATVDWLRAAFDPRAYPYFADEFVHPDECRSASSHRNVYPLFSSAPD